MEEEDDAGVEIPRLRRSNIDLTNADDGSVLRRMSESFEGIRQRRATLTNVAKATNTNKARKGFLGLRKNVHPAWRDLDDYARNNIEEVAQLSIQDDSSNTFKGNLSDILTKDVFVDMSRAAALDYGIDRKRFGVLILKYTGYKLSESMIDGFFGKLDIPKGEEMRWEQLAGYMYLVLRAHDAAAERARSIDLVYPAQGITTPHVSPTARIRGGKRNIMSMCEGAILTIWNPVVKEREAFEPVSIINLDFDSSFNSEVQSSLAPTLTWATDFIVLPEMGKLAVASGERKIYFYDSYGDYALQFVLTHFDAIPTRLCQTYSESLRATVLMWGDSDGALGCLVFPKYYTQCQHFRMHRLKGQDPLRLTLNQLEPVKANLKEYGGVHFRTWHGHSEWVNDLKWAKSINSFISVSGDTTASMIVGEPIDLVQDPPQSLKKSLIVHREQLIKNRRVNSRQNSFSVPKGGIRAFDFSSSLGLIATGGTDRVIRCWSPYMTKHPESLLFGHETGVAALAFKSGGDGCGLHKELMSIDCANIIRVWDVKEQVPILTINQQLHRLDEPASHIYFGEDTKALLLFPKSKIGILKLQPGRGSGEGLTHLTKLRCVVYNKRYNQVASACEEGIVKIWDLRTGAPVFEFRADQGSESAVNSMAFDHTYTKLIIALTNGDTCRWQYSTGQLLNTFKETRTSEKPEVTTVLFKKAGQLLSVITAGWTRKVTIYRDSPASEHTQDIYPVNDNWNSSVSHTDDITCSCLLGNNGMATGSYDGDVILWNLSTGRARKLKTKNAMQQMAPPTMLQAYAVLCLVSLPCREDKEDAAQLVISTTTGIYFWNTKVLFGDGLMGQWKASDEAGIEANALAVSSKCSRLMVGDSSGRISIYNISDYCCNKQVGLQGAPPLLKMWRAHSLTPIVMLTYVKKDSTSSNSISSLPLSKVDDTIDTIGHSPESIQSNSVESGRSSSSDTAEIQNENEIPCHAEFLISASADCRVRVWTLSGRFVGTFGQQNKWDWAQESTWQKLDTPSEIRNQDAAKERAKEKNKQLDQILYDTNEHPKPAPAWGLGPFEAPKISSTTTSENWTATSPPKEVVDALTGSSRVAMMKYIGASGSTGFYARRSLQPAPLIRSQSAPAGLRSRIPVERKLSRQGSRVLSSRGSIIDPGLPRKIGNHERSLRATERRRSASMIRTRLTMSEDDPKSFLDSAKGRIDDLAPELQEFEVFAIPESPVPNKEESSDVANDDEIPRIMSEPLGAYKPRNKKAQTRRAYSAAAPGRRSTNFNPYRDSLVAKPESLVKAESDAMIPTARDGIDAYLASAVARAGNMRAGRQSIRVSPEGPTLLSSNVNTSGF